MRIRSTANLRILRNDDVIAKLCLTTRHAKIEQNTHIIYSHKYSMDKEEEDKIVQLALLTINALVAVSLTVASFDTSRPASIIEKRLDWNLFVEKYAERKYSSRHFRMLLAPFNKLIDCIGDGLVVDETMAALRGPPISPQLILYATLFFWLEDPTLILNS